MKLPKRVSQHISETASFKLFSSKIPNNWIIRDITERDYGIDCYLELVNKNNELSGELILIQLKSRQEISWNGSDSYSISGIDIETSNYWMSFPVPVFIFLADLKNEEIYFVSVGYEVKRNFKKFIKQDAFSYKIKKSNLFEGDAGIFNFKFEYYYEQLRDRFENDLIYFLSNSSSYQEFIGRHWGLDFHLGVEISEIIFLESMYRNYKFLCSYCNVKWDIPSIGEVKKKSRERLGINSPYELYEYDLAELVKQIDSKTKELTIALKLFLKGEMDFWLYTNITVYRYVQNLNDDGEYIGY